MKTERALDGISDLAGHGHDVVTFWNEVTELMAPIVPHYMGPCWYTLDPASLLMTSHFNPAMPELPREWMELEYYEDDVHDIAKVARSEAGISTLHEATGGDPSSSPRWQANVEMGGDQELIVSLRTPAGARSSPRPLGSSSSCPICRAATGTTGDCRRSCFPSRRARCGPRRGTTRPETWRWRGCCPIRGGGLSYTGRRSWARGRRASRSSSSRRCRPGSRPC